MQTTARRCLSGTEPIVGDNHNQSLVGRKPVAMEISFHMQIKSPFDFQLQRHTSIGLPFLFIQFSFSVYNLHI